MDTAMDLADRINQIVSERIGRVQNSARMYKTIGEIMVSEFKKNIGDQRVPSDQWPESKAAKKRGGQTLRKTGRLMNSYSFNAAADGVEAGPSAPYATYLYHGVTRYPRSETFQRARIGRGVHAGRFRPSPALTPPLSQRARGHGFTYRQYSFGPWNLFWMPQDAMDRIKNVVIDEVTR